MDKKHIAMLTMLGRISKVVAISPGSEQNGVPYATFDQNSELSPWCRAGFLQGVQIKSLLQALEPKAIVCTWSRHATSSSDQKETLTSLAKRLVPFRSNWLPLLC